MLSGWSVPLQTGPPPAQLMSAASASAAQISIAVTASPAARAALFLPAVIEPPNFDRGNPVSAKLPRPVASRAQVSLGTRLPCKAIGFPVHWAPRRAAQP